MSLPANTYFTQVVTHAHTHTHTHTPTYTHTHTHTHTCAHTPQALGLHAPEAMLRRHTHPHTHTHTHTPTHTRFASTFKIYENAI